jgi:multimeric flavodoxin WrbA
MKVTAILGSPHGKRGNTAEVLEALLGATKAEVTLFSLDDLELAPCKGCDACHKVGHCAIRDDFQGILGAMQEADAIVLASPNYIFSVTAQMKALFDRCCGPIHIAALDGKYAAAVVTSGGDESPEVEDYMLRFLRAIGCYTVGSVGASVAELFDPTKKDAVLQEADDLGRALAAAVVAGEPIAGQEPERQAFKTRMRRLVESQRSRWLFEYEWWQTH